MTKPCDADYTHYEHLEKSHRTSDRLDKGEVLVFCQCLSSTFFWLLLLIAYNEFSIYPYIQQPATLWTIAHQPLLSMGFSRQEYWVGFHFLLQGIFPTQGSNSGLLHCRQILHWVTGEARFLFRWSTFFNPSWGNVVESLDELFYLQYQMRSQCRRKTEQT